MKKILSLLSILGVLHSFAQTITGTGTVNYLPKFTNSTVIGNSIISQGSGNNLVGIGTTSPRATLDIIRQCGANNLAAILIEQDILVGNCPGGQTLGTDYFVVRTFNSITSAYQHYFYVNGNGRVALGNNSAATQLDVQALSSNDPFQLRNNSGSTLLRVLASGNIGVRTASPAGPLDVRNSSNAILMQLNSTGNLSIGNVTPTYRLDVNCQQSGAAQPPFRFVNYLGNVTMVGTNSDRVGINVANPDTYGGSLVVGAVGTGGNALDLVSTSASGWCNQLRFYSASGVRHLITDDRTNNYLLIRTGNGGGALNKLRVEGNQDLIGNLSVSGTGIITGATTLSSTLSVGGTSDFTDRVKIGNVSVPNANYMLYVEKGVLAERFKCAVKSDQTNWSDYVFEKNYKLMNLPDLERYVKKHKHLPNIPSAEEVYRDGIDLADMNARLLEKIEELTLYVIAIEKRVNQLSK